MDEIHSNDTERLLHNRKKNVSVFLLPAGKQFRVVAELEDSVHHLRIDMIVNQPSLRITEIACEMIAVPDTLCRQAQDFFAPFIGHRIAPGFINKVKQKAGNGKGCTHLVNLFHEACYNLPMAQSVFGKEQLETMFPGLTKHQLYNFFLWFQPELCDSCVRYAKNSSFMQAVHKVEMPAGAHKLRALSSN